MRDRIVEVTGFDLEVRSRGGGEGEHDQTGFIGDGFSRRDQIGDGFLRRDQTSGAVGWGLDLGFTSDSSLCSLAWAWRE